VLLNAKTGEIYTLASHPYFNANTLEDDFNNLMSREDAPDAKPNHPGFLSHRHAYQFARAGSLLE
jgi:cell division protein FtsI/penicillin-binding protein 2